MVETTTKRKGRPARDTNNVDTQSNVCIITDPAMEPFYISKDNSNFTVIEKTTVKRGFRGAVASGKDTENVIGYSGHDNGIAMAIVAYTLGARIVEKHFTLNRTLKGTDHVFSLEPQGMQKMVRDLKRSALALGDGEKIIYADETAPIKKMGKMIIAARDLKAGHLINFEDLEFRFTEI